MRQQFILEKEDYEFLKSGGKIPLGGKIELAGDVPRKYIANGDRGKNAQIREKIISYLRNQREPMAVKNICSALGLDNKMAHNMIQILMAQKLVIGSANGWRAVHDATAIKLRASAKLGSNGANHNV